MMRVAVSTSSYNVWGWKILLTLFPRLPHTHMPMLICRTHSSINHRWQHVNAKNPRWKYIKIFTRSESNFELSTNFDDFSLNPRKYLFLRWNYCATVMMIDLFACWEYWNFRGWYILGGWLDLWTKLVWKLKIWRILWKILILINFIVRMF